MKDKRFLIVLLAGLILALAFTTNPTGAWSIISGPGAQTVPTAPPTPPTPTDTQTSGGGGDPQPVPTETARVVVVQATATPGAETAYPVAVESAYPLVDLNATLESYPMPAGTATPAVKGQVIVLETKAGDDGPGAQETDPAKNPAGTGMAWIGYAVGGLVLIAALAFILLRSRKPA